MEGDVVVVGSCMIDLVCYAPRLPKSGETIHGNNFLMGHGGKGANQCVAAAKLGSSCCLIGRLGDDSFGKNYKRDIKELGVNVEHLTLTANTSSGMAQITVSSSGENHIVIVPGANNKLSTEDIKRAESVLLGAKVAIFQFETPLQTTIEALNLIKNNGKGLPKTVVNGAPAIDNLDPSIYSLCDIFCVNETEAEVFSGKRVDTIEDAFEAIKILLELGCHTVIITLGSKGAVFGSMDSDSQHIPSETVKPVDTTGAGDAFIGALAFFTSKFENLSLEERIRRSCAVAAASVLKKGTQQSFPTKMDLPEKLFMK